MNASIEPIASLVQNPRFAALWLDALLKSFVVLAFAGGLCVMWRRAAAATRHLIWFLALASLPLLPLLSHVLPASSRPLWSVSSEMVSGNQISLSLDLAPVKSRTGINNLQPTAPQIPVEQTQNRSGKCVFAAQISHNWLVTGLIAWAAGIALTVLYSALGQFQLKRISGTARRLETPEWTSLLNEACQTVGLRRRVILLQSSENIMPLTWGWLRPRVLMPLEAEKWPVERRRIVLMHELAHVKRLDCLTQIIARMIAALYWFNPLAWIAARRMCVERERACDDLVLNGGCKPSDYAGHLVQIARTFRRAPQAAGIAMARSSNLEQRVTAVVDASRCRRLRPVGLAGALTAIAIVIFCIGGYKTSFASDDSSEPLRQQQMAQLEKFSAEKEKQSETLAAAAGEEFTPLFRQYLDAATSGDWQTVTNMYESFKKRHPQYARTKGIPPDIQLRTSYWSPVLEISLVYDHVVNCDPKYTEIAVDGIVNSIPAGAIYFGGTDPGRGLPTAFSKSQINADPFYTLTQNALADETYLEYLRNTYGDKRQLLEELGTARSADAELPALDAQFHVAEQKAFSLEDGGSVNNPELKAANQLVDDLNAKITNRLAAIEKNLRAEKNPNTAATGPSVIFIPSREDQQKCFTDYIADAQARLQHDKQFPKEPKQIKPGEEIHDDPNGHVQVSGQVAVMEINARLAKLIFDKNPGHEFYLEESFPLDWMYPYLEPHGLIMKINREPLAELPDEVVQRDHDYWQKRVSEMVGDWLTDETPVKTVTDFAEKVYVRKDLGGFTGDPKFVHDNYAPKMFSKWRSAIGGVYSWRAGVSPDNSATPAQYLPKGDAERQRMIKETDFAFKQALALCPSSPEAVFRYATFLMSQNRKADALLIAQTATHLDPNQQQFKYLVQNLSR